MKNFATELEKSIFAGRGEEETSGIIESWIRSLTDSIQMMMKSLVKLTNQYFLVVRDALEIFTITILYNSTKILVHDENKKLAEAETSRQSTETEKKENLRRKGSDEETNREKKLKKLRIKEPKKEKK